MTSLGKLVFAGLFGVLAVGLPGCGGGPRYVKVSGVVTLNGKPYKGAVVNFQPIATKEDANPGRGSYGHTDEHGKFQLVVDDKITGAVAGKHRVRIATVWELLSSGADPALGTPDGDPKARRKVPTDPIPAEWNTNSTKEFEVPLEGTDRANFDIVTRTK
jgi:hypothetical protein